MHFDQEIYLTNVLLFETAKCVSTATALRMIRIIDTPPIIYIVQDTLRGPALAPRVLTLHALLRQTLLAAMQQPSIPRLPCNLTWLSVQMWPGRVPSPSVGVIWAEPIIAKPSPLQAQARGPAPANEMLLGVGSATGDRYLLLSHEKVQTGKGALLPAPPFLCVAPCPHPPRWPGGLPEWRRGWRRGGKSSGLLRKGLSRQVLGLDTSTDFPLASTY